MLWSVVRGLVSKKKRRYQQDGFDLDLSYITDRVIAMGYPSSGREGLYRNPMSEVVRFFEKFHAGRYKVYNLCSERAYNLDNFEGRVARYPFDDHQAPPLAMMEAFCKDAHEWLSESKHVIIAHCKAGKGRTGVMICCYLIYSGLFTDPEEAMSFYAKQRTKNNKGVTIASQRRYIHYLADILNGQGPRQPRPVVMQSIHLSMECSADLVIAVYQRVEAMSEPQLVCCNMPTKGAPEPEATVNSNRDGFTFSPKSRILLVGDIKIECYNKEISKTKKEFYTWFNTSYLPEHNDEGSVPFILDRLALDKVNKKLKGSIQLQLFFGDINQPVPKEDSVTPSSSLQKTNRPSLKDRAAARKEALSASRSAQVDASPSTTESRDVSMSSLDSAERVDKPMSHPTVSVTVSAVPPAGHSVPGTSEDAQKQGALFASQASLTSREELEHRGKATHQVKTGGITPPYAPVSLESSEMGEEVEQALRTLESNLTRMRNFMQQLQEEEAMGMSMHQQMEAVLHNLEGTYNRLSIDNGNMLATRNQHLVEESVRVESVR